jgi:uncharacterized protein (TIGR03435 family)
MRVLAVWFLAGFCLLAQPEKCIDSVRVSPDRGPCGPGNQAGCTNLSAWGSSAFTATYVSLDLLVELACGVEPMLRAFLKDRFQLETHNARKQEDGFELVLAKDGLKLKASDPGADTAAIVARGRLFLGRATLDRIASLLSSPLGKPVNQTGIPGTFNLDLQFAPEGSQISQTGTERPSIFTAVQEQLGLKLEPRKVMSDILVIDRCESVPTGN